MRFGSDFDIPDGILDSSLTTDHLKIPQKLVTEFGVKFIVTTHDVGGNQDHDTSFVVSQYSSLKLDFNLFSFPLYCQSSFSKELFSLMNTHGSYIKSEMGGLRTSFLSFVTAIGLISNYRSQWKIWIGLGLLLLFTMLRKYQFLNPTYVSLSNYPEANILFYEPGGHADGASVTSHGSKIGIISD